MKYYSLDSIKQYEKDTQYFMIFGGRSNGKSFAVARRNIDRFFKYGEQFIIVKRFEEDIKGKNISTMFDNQIEYINETYKHNIKFYQGKWYVYPSELNDVKLKDCEIIGHTLSISGSDRAKGSQYPKVTTIVLEEFMSMNQFYLYDEINLFINLVSTVARHRTNVKIYMLGNTISKSNPYSTALGVKLHRMKTGEVIIKSFGNGKYKTNFLIQRTENVLIQEEKINGEDEKIAFNIFGNSGVGDMITSGDFETHNYPKECSGVTFSELQKYLNKNIKYTCFNKYDKSKFIIRYEDYFYTVYIKKNGGNFILGFRELDINTINKKEIYYCINNKEYLGNNVTNIPKIVSYRTKNIVLNESIDVVINCLIQELYVFFNNDNGEDVINAFRQSGITEL